ncbi:MAG TPA: MFS transporter, partial [Acinetobacter radioresistens]|nr:MFS transporter [Acinetobacter radioresistens]
TWLGQQFGWRTGFEFSALIAFLTVAVVILYIPKIQVQATAS